MLSVILQYMPFEDGVLLRQTSKTFKERVWPNSYTTININEHLLAIQVVQQPARRRRTSSTMAAASQPNYPYSLAPKLIQELTSVSSVSFTGLNMTKVFKQQQGSENTLLQCLEELTSRQHNRKISKLTLTGVTIDSIFDAETFCKKFVSRLLQIDELIINKCQPMFIEKFFLSVCGGATTAMFNNNAIGASRSRLNMNQRSISQKVTPSSQNGGRATIRLSLSELKYFSIVGVNLEQIETALQRFLDQQTSLRGLHLDCQQEAFIVSDTSHKASSFFENQRSSSTLLQQ